MDPNELLRIVDAIHRDKNIDKEDRFRGHRGGAGFRRQEALRRRSRCCCRRSTVQRHHRGSHNGVPMDPAEMAERIGAERPSR